MAQKRMFDKSITSDDTFLEMPIGSQLLYFHLSMNADDDGFINNWKSIMRMIGAKEDDLKVLYAKSYILPFESGVIVIKHWKINNYLRNDRYKPTRFKEEASKLITDKNSVYQLYTSGIPSIDKNSIDKNSIDKNSIDIPKQLENKNDVQIYNECTTNIANIKDKDITITKDKDRNIYMSEFESLWEIYPNKKGKDVAIKKYLLARKQGATYEQIRQGLESYIHYCKINNLETQYIKHGSTWFSQKAWKDDYNTNLKGKKQIIPEWFNKEIEASPLTEEELKEMNDLLSEFKED